MTLPNNADSHPFHFSRRDLQEMAMERDRWLDYNHPLDCISVDLIRAAQNDALRGAYAQLQWMWEQLEPADSILATCVERRLGALVRIPWEIKAKDGLNDAEAVLAEAQLRTLRDFANSIDNLDEAIMSFAQASFRHYRRVQLFETEFGRLRLNVTDNWNWCRNGYNGDWLWNPDATFGLTRGEPLPVPPESIITRICPRPIDQPAMMLCLDRKNAKAQWYVFNSRYGTPPLFVMLPPGVDEATKKSYIDFAVQCISNAAGVLPGGSDVKAITPGTTGPDTFKGIIDISTQELVLRATGGLMTMLTAPGAGTNTETGSAHQDAFDDLAEREAEEIAAVLDAGLFAPALDQWHPGQPHLVEFVMRRPDSNNASGAVANITSLASAGYRATAQQVADLTGLQVTDNGGAPAAVTPATAPAYSALMARTHRRFAPLMKYPPARAVFDAACNSRIDLANRIMQQAAHPAPETNPADAPLSDKELAAIKAVGGLSVADLLHADAPALARGMQAAVAAIQPRATNKGDNCPNHKKGLPCKRYDAEGKAPTVDGASDEKREAGKGESKTDKTPSSRKREIIELPQKHPSAIFAAYDPTIITEQGKPNPNDKPFKIAEGGEREAQAIKEAFGRDGTGYIHSMAPSAAQHAIEEHGNDSNHRPKNNIQQISLTPDELNRVPDHIRNADSIKCYIGSDDRRTLEYSRSIGQRTFTIIEKLGNPNRRHHRPEYMFKTMWISEPAKKQG